jgi:hypothetical protein
MTPDRFWFNPETMSLDPPHFKKVVYLDQFVISEIVNAIDPHANRVMSNSVSSVRLLAHGSAARNRHSMT